ncbi:HmuY family protein [Halorhodospira abdelmalekii]|uniref:HmuY family protein n=1 Tax=Halorhodospira abdelmalekii TaxID=421629 RepID=UPI00190382FB
MVDYRDADHNTGHVTLRFRGLDAVMLDGEDDNGAGNAHPGAASAQGTDDPFAHLPGRYIAPASTEEGFEELQVDASDGWAYVNLDRGAVVDPDEDDWHLALNRFRVRLNSGPSGPGEVHGALGLQPPAALYSTDDSGNPDFDSPLGAEFRAAEPRQHVARLVSTDFSDPDNSVSTEWQADRLVPAIGDEFWKMDRSDMPPSIVADEDYGWLIRGRDGESHARMRVTDLFFTMSGGADFKYELTLNIAEDGDGGFGAEDVLFAGELDRNDGGKACFDFVSATPGAADCSGDDWDLMVYWDGADQGMGGDLFGILLNGGYGRNGEPRSGSAAVIGPAPMEWYTGEPGDERGLGELDRADEVPAFGHAMAIIQDQPGGLFDDYPWHELLSHDAATPGGPVWPNFRVYLIRDQVAVASD